MDGEVPAPPDRASGEDAHHRKPTCAIYRHERGPRRRSSVELNKLRFAPRSEELFVEILQPDSAFDNRVSSVTELPREHS
jgi:hypothetical protein